METFNFFLTAVKLHKIVIVPECNFKLYRLEFVYREIRTFKTKTYFFPLRVFTLSAVVKHIVALRADVDI